MAPTTQAVTPYHPEPLEAKVVEQALIDGDLGKLTPTQRLSYLDALCQETGLNALTRPFDFIKDDAGKLRVYTRKDACEQLRKLHRISTKILVREIVDNMYVVTAQASMPDGQVDEALGVVSLEGLQGQKKANAMMKCETKAKRRVTLSICGLGAHADYDDEPAQGAGVVNLQTGEIREEKPARRAAPTHEDDTAQQRARKALVLEAHQLFTDILKPLKHAGMRAAVAHHCFQCPWTKLGEQPFDVIDRGMPLLRHLCAALAEDGLPEMHPDQWIAWHVQELAKKAMGDIVDVPAEDVTHQPTQEDDDEGQETLFTAEASAAADRALAEDEEYTPEP